MKTKITLASKDNCTGCGVCIDVCPKECISYTPEGFHFYPNINHEACVRCGLCVKSCPSLNEISFVGNRETQKYHACWNKNEDELLSSTSGGVGTALAKKAIEKGYYVVGSVLTEEGVVKHVIATDEDEIFKFKGSKYVQSICIGVFKECKRLLEADKRIFFIGTPCQIEAFKNIIPKNKVDNVITCGIVCHGVNSPMVWKDFWQYLEKKNKSKLVAYNFRSKEKGWQKTNGDGIIYVSMKFANGKEIKHDGGKNIFHSWFGRHYILRQSCLDCKYRNEERNSDIVIGDFWGIHKLHAELDTKKGISVLVSITNRGEAFLKSIRDVVSIETDPSQTIKVLKGFINRKSKDTIELEKKRQAEFEQEYMLYGFEYMKKQYPIQSFLSRLIDYIKFKLKV